MTDTEANEGQEQIIFASADDLASLDLEAVLGEVDEVDAYALQLALIHAANAAEQRESGAAFRGYRLLAILSGIPMRVEDPAETWGPRFEQAEARQYRGSDMRGEQNPVLAAFAEQVKHPALRARIADIAWYNDRSLVASAARAVEAYREIIDGRLSGSLKRSHEQLADSLIDLGDYLHRALQILALSGRKKDVKEAIGDTFARLYSKARDTGQYVAFDRIARLGIEYGLIDWAAVAPDAESVATARTGGDYPMAVQLAWNLAAQGYDKLGRTDDRRRCQNASVDETLANREKVNSAIAQAHWTRKAIGELRAAGGFADRVAALRVELRQLEEESIDEYRPMFLPLEFGEERDAIAAQFAGLSLPQALLRFAYLASSIPIEKLKEQARENRKTGILGSLMGTSHADKHGRVIAQTPASATQDDPDGDWYKAEVQRYLEIWRTQVVATLIEPARVTLMMRFPIEDRYFMPIAMASPFVPEGHEYIFALGFARFWQGDFTSAAYLLIPQLENSLRFVLLSTGVDSAKIKPDLLQEDRSLRGLLESVRPELEERFGADLINEIDLLFNYRPGPALRHEMAHGKMTTLACYHADAIYGCWLIYRLTCVPIGPRWKDEIAPAIEASAG